MRCAGYLLRSDTCLVMLLEIDSLLVNTREKVIFIVECLAHHAARYHIGHTSSPVAFNQQYSMLF